jgi:hypothetical protein
VYCTIQSGTLPRLSHDGIPQVHYLPPPGGASGFFFFSSSVMNEMSSLGRFFSAAPFWMPESGVFHELSPHASPQPDPRLVVLVPAG